MAEVGVIAQIWRYPVSSLRGEQLASAAFDEAGIAGDRRWGIVDAASNAVANPPERRWRSAPEIAARSGPDGPEIRVPRGEWLPASTAAATAALTEHFGFPTEVRRHVPYETEASAATVAPRYRRAQLHVLTTASMRALEDRLAPGAIVDPRRFRPNLVIESSEGAAGFVEAEWVGRRIAVGAAVLQVTEPCERCAFTTLAQGGLPFQREILSGIVRHGGGGFGALCAIVEPHAISVGDPIRLV